MKLPEPYCQSGEPRMHFNIVARIYNEGSWYRQHFFMKLLSTSLFCYGEMNHLLLLVTSLIRSAPLAPGSSHLTHYYPARNRILNGQLTILEP